MKKNYYYYLLFLAVLVYFIIFHYFPMYGIVIAFKDFRILNGILKSPWVGMKHFNRLFNSMLFWQSVRNTVKISLLKLVFGFPAPIIFALLLNEVNQRFFKRFVQTVSYLPYFISWVALGGIVRAILSPNGGVFNQLMYMFGKAPVYFITESSYFVAILVITWVWQQMGWGSIIYLAAITSVDTRRGWSKLSPSLKNYFTSNL